MSTRIVYGALSLIAVGVTIYASSVSAHVGWYPMILLLAIVANLTVWYLRLPLLVEARCDDEKLVVASSDGEEQRVLLKDIVAIDSFSSSGTPNLAHPDSPSPLFEYGVVYIRQPGKPVRVLRFRMLPSAGHLGTHPALAKLIRRVKRQDS